MNSFGIEKTVSFRSQGRLFNNEKEAMEDLKSRQLGELRKAVNALYVEMGRSGTFGLERAIDIENALRNVGAELDEMFAILTRIKALEE